MCTKKIVIERTRDLIYLKFVATDFSQCLEEAEQQAEASVDVPYPPLQIVNSVPFFLYLYPISAPFLNPLSSPSPPSLLSLLINSLSS